MNEVSKNIDKFNKITNESYIFGHNKSDEEKSSLKSDDLEIKETEDDIIDLDINTEIEDTTEIIDNEKPVVNSIDSNRELYSIREISLELLTKLNPIEDAEAYKLTKTIWDGCDKFFFKDTKKSKEPKQEPKQETNKQ